MALSFGRGKKGDGTEASPNATGGSSAGGGGVGEEILDESWFENAFEEEGTAPTAPPAAPVRPQAVAPQPAQPAVPDSEPNFDIFAELDTPSTPPAPGGAPSTGAFGFPEAVPMTATPFDSTSFDATPFDTAATGAMPEAEAPAKAKGGGLKKLLPVLGLLIVLGGGGFFWISQQGGGGTDETEGTVSLSPGPPGPPGPAMQPGPAPGGAPGAVKPAGKPPKASPTQESPFQKRIGKLWAEGVVHFHKGNKAGARKKWEAAIKLARSKPGHETSAAAIQEAIDKKLK